MEGGDSAEGDLGVEGRTAPPAKEKSVANLPAVEGEGSVEPEEAMDKTPGDRRSPSVTIKQSLDDEALDLSSESDDGSIDTLPDYFHATKESQYKGEILERQQIFVSSTTRNFEFLAKFVEPIVDLAQSIESYGRTIGDAPSLLLLMEESDEETHDTMW